MGTNSSLTGESIKLNCPPGPLILNPDVLVTEDVEGLRRLKDQVFLTLCYLLLSQLTFDTRGLAACPDSLNSRMTSTVCLEGCASTTFGARLASAWIVATF